MEAMLAEAYALVMSKPLSLAILVVGVVLLVIGLNAGNSFASEAKEAVTGTPTDKSLILTVAGIVGIVVGALSAFTHRRN